MRVAYVGSLVGADRVHQFSGGSIAGNKFQIGLLSAFEAQGVALDQFLVPPLASYPRGSQILVRMSADQIGVAGAHVVPFVNVLGLKQVTIAIGMFVRLMTWAWRTRGDAERVVVVYNLFSFMAGPVLALRRFTRIPVVAVVADVQPPAARGLAKREADFQHSAMGAFDALVEISPHIGDDFAPTLPRLLIEGGVHASACAVPDQDPRPAAAGSHSVVLFSGALDENSGIEHLLGAFALLDDDSLVLRILGKGQYLDAVLGAAQRDRRIDYVGYVDNEQAVAMQRSADVLVSPRLPDDHTTRYTFPSKLMEYLATGNVVVSSRLPGIGADYIDHLVVPRDDSDQALADCLAEAVRLAPADHQRRQAQLDFMATKSWTTRSGELVEFLAQRVAP